VSSDDELRKHRDAIDALDREILARLSERARHAQAIGKLKEGAGGPAYRPEREAQVLAHIAGANPGPLSDDAVRLLFRQVMSACLALERPMRIAYLGPPGTFTHAAVESHFGAFVEGVPEASIDEVFRAAESGRADYAVVPVENSTEGAVGRTLDLMVASDLGVVGEVKLRVHQNLLSKVATLGEIKRVYSHAQSFAQTVQWLSRHLPSVPRVVAASNAEAARLAAQEPGAAAIAGSMAATIYGLPTLASHIEDEPNNTTRFWVLGDQHVGASGRDETSLVTSAPNRPGAVHALLEPLAKHGVSMTRFESRPARTGHWEYLFYIDVTGHRDDPPLAAALAELGQRAPYLKVLGSYPAAREP